MKIYLHSDKLLTVYTLSLLK